MANLRFSPGIDQSDSFVPDFHPFLPFSVMREFLVLFSRLLTAVVMPLGPVGVSAIVADSLLMQQPLAVIHQPCPGSSRTLGSGDPIAVAICAHWRH
jgi:hypothetical protein